jgi:hypothetical protein
MNLEPCKISELKVGQTFWVSSKKSCQTGRTKLIVLDPDDAAIESENVLARFVSVKINIPFKFPNDLKVQKIC